MGAKVTKQISEAAKLITTRPAGVYEHITTISFACASQVKHWCRFNAIIDFMHLNIALPVDDLINLSLVQVTNYGIGGYYDMHYDSDEVRELEHWNSLKGDHRQRTESTVVRIVGR